MAGKGAAKRKARLNSMAKPAPVKLVKVGTIDYKDVATLRKFILTEAKSALVESQEFPFRISARSQRP